MFEVGGKLKFKCFGSGSWVAARHRDSPLRFGRGVNVMNRVSYFVSYRFNFLRKTHPKMNHNSPSVNSSIQRQCNGGGHSKTK